MRLALAALLLTVLLASIYWAGAGAGAKAPPGARNELEAALSVPKERTRAVRLARYFDEASPADLEATLQAYESAEAYVDALALVLLADWWAGFDPPGAFDHTLGWRFRDADAARVTIVRSWGRRDPASAQGVVDEHRGTPRSDLLSQALAVGWAEGEDPSGVWAYLETLPRGLERQKALLAVISRSFVSNGVDETLRAVEALPDDGTYRFKLQAYRRTAWALARYDPERAKQWAVAQNEGPFGDGLLRLVGVSRAAAEGADALQWLQTLGPGEQRDEAVRETFRAWLTRDRQDAIDWLRDAEPDPAFEPALVLLVSAVARSDPEQARGILDRIEDPMLRETAYAYLARAWMTHDREAALAWFQAAPVSEETRRRVLEERPGVPTPRRQLPVDSAPP